MGYGRTPRDGARRDSAGGWGVLGLAVEACDTPGVVQTGHARPVVVIPALGFCPCGERRGFKGKERAGAAAGAGRRRGVRTHGEERRG